MDDKEQQALVRTTELQIASLLAALEERTGCYVEGLRLRDVETTTVSSRSREFLRGVEIDLRRQPGSRWET
jgi:hypothetical protein